MSKVIEAFHSLTGEDSLISLNSSPRGLGTAEVEKRIVKFGFNELPETKKINPVILFLKQFKSPLVYILIIASVISWFAGNEIDTFVILFIVILNAIIGFVQEYRAEKAVSSLRLMIRQWAVVLRNGNKMKIPARELVPGDIIFVEEGDKVAADARLLKANNLRVVESSLTGESVPVSKHTNPLPVNTPLSDRKNMIWNGTYIATGGGIAVVTETGSETTIGKIAGSLSQIKSASTHFQKKIKVLSLQMGLFAISLSCILFIVGYFIRKFDLTEIFIFTLAAMVSAIPEGLPAILSVVLAIGAYRMTRRNAIIREFTATETLGAVNVIMTDKTGTLTQNTLNVKLLWSYQKSELKITGNGWEPKGDFLQDEKKININDDYEYLKLIEIAACSNNSSVLFNEAKQKYEISGDPTEAALLVMAKKYLTTIENSFEKLDDFPFNSENKLRATLCSIKNKQILMVIGAPEKILGMSSYILTPEGLKEMNEDIHKEISAKINNWSGKAMRVIALAWKENDLNGIINIDKEKLIFAGLAGMNDPPREDVPEAIKKCKDAGIRVIMATGDHKNTAIAIAKEIGIIDSDNKGEGTAFTGQQLEEMGDVEFESVITKANVFARLSPEMKLKIATKLKSKGFLIAMTGDGVNDAPALKKADVGIAMGIMGTDVAREAAQVVLADDNFSTIINAIEEGRIVFNNSRQASYFLITTNFAEILTLIVSVVSGFPLPLTATQVLWLNLVTDGTQGIALATEPGHGEILKQKPVNPAEPILNKSLLPFLIINALVMTALVMFIFNYFLQVSEEKARTGAFLVMSFTQLFNTLNMRSLELSMFKIGIFSNKYINAGLIVAIILQIAIVEIPALKEIFRLQRIEIHELFVIVILCSLVLWIGELYKLFKYRK